MEEKKTILVVEDDTAIQEILKFNLQLAGYNVTQAFDGPEGLKAGLKLDADLILMDIMLPGLDGFSICEEVRKQKPDIPILLLTAREDEDDKVHGLEIGADDYITKPFSMKELLARIKANIRRLERIEATTESDEVWKEGNLALYPSQMMVTRNGEPLSLSQREFDLIRYLWSHKNKVLSREELMEKVWSFSYYGDLRSVDVAMRRLREKLEDNPAVPVFLLTRRGAGYLFSTT